MSLSLPPKSVIRPGEENARLVHEELTKIIAGHAQARTTYQFYEDLDEWLGPWGESGYLIGYGKKYNILFTTDRRLNRDASARQWVWRTTILLQEAIRDFLVALTRGHYRNMSINGLTERQLREMAFRSHPRAYTQAGLTMAVMTSPSLALHIAAIPGSEFNPTSPNFGATIEQVLETAAIVLPGIAGNSLAALMPAHSGYLRRAARRDMQNMLNRNNMNVSLGRLRSGLQNGDYDNIAWLDRLVRHLNRIQWPDQGTARAAAEIVRLAQTRRRSLVGAFERFSSGSGVLAPVTVPPMGR